MIKSRREIEIENGDKFIDLVKLGKIKEVAFMLEEDEKEKKLIVYAESRGWTALHYACQYKHQDIALLLIREGADAHFVERFNRTPLDFVNDPSRKKELEEAYDAYKKKLEDERLLLEEEERIAQVQARIRQKMEEVAKSEMDAARLEAERAEMEMARKAEQTVKLNSVEKLLYALEEKDRAIARLKIESEREIFDLKKQLYAAQSEISQLKELTATQTATEKQHLQDIKRLQEDLHLSYKRNVVDQSHMDKSLGKSNSGGISSDSHEEQKQTFSLTSMFGRK